MHKSNRVMTVLAVAMLIVLGAVNLYCLYQSAKKTAVRKSGAKGEAMDLTVRFTLVPNAHINIVFDHH